MAQKSYSDSFRHVEMGKITVNATDSATYTFSSPFQTTPYVALGKASATGDFYITSVSTTSVTVYNADTSSGEVYVIAMAKGE